MGKDSENRMEGSMKLKTVVHEQKVQFSLFICILKNYDGLDRDVLHFQTYENHEVRGVFKLIKTAENLNVAFRFGCTKADAMFYLSNGILVSKTVSALEISKGLYFAQFPHNLVFHEDGQFNKTGLLKIVFKFKADFGTVSRSQPCGEIGVVSDVDELLQEMKLFQLLSHEPDVRINVPPGVSLKAHKCILSARSQFFREYFRKNKEAEDFTIPDAVPGIMHEVLLYLYSGELSSMNAECMARVMEVAYLLKIKSLKERCRRYFEETRSWDVLKDITFSEYAVE